MPKFTICISGYTGPDAEAQTAPQFRPLLNRPVDSYSEMEKWVYEKATADGEPDLWGAEYDSDTGTLTAWGQGTGPGPSVSWGYASPDYKGLLPALNALTTAIYGG